MSKSAWFGIIAVVGLFLCGCEGSRGQAVIKVVDDAGRAVAGAKIKMDGLKTSQEHAIWAGLFGPGPPGEIALLKQPRRV